jgi:tetratricopeptide (TPR) repeat protein
LHHAKLAIEIGEVKEATQLNNVGYLFMRTGDLSAAKRCFAEALQKENDAGSSLLLYNCAVLESMNGEQERAITFLQQLQDKFSRSAEPEEIAECLLVPSTEPDKSDFKECWKLSIREAGKLLESYTKGQSSATGESGDQR